MHIIKIDGHINLIDLKPAGIENFVGSYVLKGENAAIVETGPLSTLQNLLAGLKRLSVKPEEVAYVAVSHIHIDHSGAVGTLMKHLPKAKLIVHQRGSLHTANPEALWTQSREALGELAKMYGKPEAVSEERIIAATEGMALDIGNNIKLRVFETLGHSSHHLIYYETVSQGIFTGDAAGMYLNKFDVVVPITPAPFRLDMALASLRRLVDLKPRFMYYSHFGKAHDPLGRLQTYSRQLKLWVEIAKQGIEEGEDLKRIRERIIEHDTALHIAEEHIRNHPILSKTVLYQSIEGVLKYVEKYGISDNLPWL